MGKYCKYELGKYQMDFNRKAKRGPNGVPPNGREREDWSKDCCRETMNPSYFYLLFINMIKY